MKICLISGEFPPMQGGVGDYTREMARAFAALGHQVVVVASRISRSEDARGEPFDRSLHRGHLRHGSQSASVALGG